MKYFDPRLFYVIHDRRLVYLEVPKVASTSMLFTIGQSYNIQFNPTKIHTDPFWHRLRGTLGKELSSYYKFSFVRNPFDRLVSCYKEKVVKPYHNSDLPYWFNRKHFSLPKNASFREFVEFAVEIPDHLADRHFKSQTAILYQDGTLLVDWLGRFENLAADWATFAKRYNYSPHLAHKTSSRDVQRTHQDYRLYYTPELAELVYQRYQRDFELFGYQDAHQELLAFLDAQA